MPRAFVENQAVRELVEREGVLNISRQAFVEG
jgi:hypothetical protein